jgi:hypothetical protein
MQARCGNECFQPAFCCIIILCKHIVNVIRHCFDEALLFLLRRDDTLPFVKNKSASAKPPVTHVTTSIFLLKCEELLSSFEEKLMFGAL